jgi:hypothetical protein
VAVQASGDRGEPHRTRLTNTCSGSSQADSAGSIPVTRSKREKRRHTYELGAIAPAETAPIGICEASGRRDQGLSCLPRRGVGSQLLVWLGWWVCTSVMQTT